MNPVDRIRHTELNELRTQVRNSAPCFGQISNPLEQSLKGDTKPHSDKKCDIVMN